MVIILIIIGVVVIPLFLGGGNKNNTKAQNKQKSAHEKEVERVAKELEEYWKRKDSDPVRYDVYKEFMGPWTKPEKILIIEEGK